MYRFLSYLVALLLAGSALTGCTAQSSTPQPVVSPDAEVAEDVKPVPPSKEVVGKWRHETSDAKTKKTSVYHFLKDGHLEVEVNVSTPDRNTTDLVKRAVVKVDGDGDKVSVIDISRTGADGVEQTIPAARRKTRTYQVQVKGDELTWSELDENGKPSPTPLVMKRVKDEKK